MQSRKRNIIIHILGCIVFLSLPVFFSPDFGDIKNLVQVNFFRRDFCLSLLLLLFFYVNYYYLTPRFYVTKKHALFYGAILGCYAIIVFVPELFMWLSPQQPQHIRGFDHPMRHYWLPYSLRHSFLQFLIILIFSLLLRIREQLKRTESEKLTAELSYLKAQINPHFLFNTLNSIYSLAILKSDKTPDAIVKLSGMMRYVLHHNDEKLVPLEKEIDYISNYIELQKMRLSPAIKLSYSCDAETTGKKIAPLMLIPFIENAFKHGVNSEENSDIEIKITSCESYVLLVVTNNCVPTNNNTLNKSGLGIENTKQRLDLIYPENHTLTISQKNNCFTVNLLLTLYD
ncbi:MAG: sensor histidine kinase [Bacteroidota bacterium]